MSEKSCKVVNKKTSVNKKIRSENVRKPLEKQNKENIPFNSKENLVRKLHEKSEPKLKKLINKTSQTDPKYWQVLAQERQDVLEGILEQKRQLCERIEALEQENEIQNQLIEEATACTMALVEMYNELEPPDV